MFTIQEVRRLKWCNKENTLFSCEVKYSEFNEWHPTGVNKSDPYEHIQTIWKLGIAGVYGPIEKYIES